MLRVLDGPDRRRLGGPIQSQRALEGARKVALRSMDKRLEIVRPGRASLGGGAPDEPPFVGGRVWARLQRGSRALETTAPSMGVGGDFEWEWALPLNTALQSDDRLAWPALFPFWQSGTAYALSRCVVPPNQLSGTSPFFMCVSAGVSGPVEPDWPRVKSGICDDGATRNMWQFAGWASLFEIVMISENHSDPNELIVKCKELS